jgi:hypothetical protein
VQFRAPKAREVTVADWPFEPGPIPPAPRSCPAILECWHGSVAVERITGQAWVTRIAFPTDRAPRFEFRFVPDLDLD